MELLNILYIPPSPPSISYRPWASATEGIPLLRWFVERLIYKYGSVSLLIVCHDETDRERAEEAIGELDVLATVSQGDSLLAALGELAAVFPRRSLAYFHPEMMFAPLDLLDRMADHHEANLNDFTAASDLPELLAPEIAVPGLLAALAAVHYDGCTPSPREAVRRLSALWGDSVRAEPFLARSVYSIPRLPRVSRMQSADDVQRARQILTSVPPSSGFEALQRSPTTTFDPLVGLPDITPASSVRPRLLYLTPGSVYSGAEESLRSLIEALAPLGFSQTAVVGLEGVLSDALSRAGCNVITANWAFNAPPAPGGKTPDPTEIFAAAVMDRVQPDVVHCNSHPGAAFVREVRVRAKPLVAHVRTAVYCDHQDLFDAASHFISVSEFVADRLQAHAVPRDRISVIPDGVDTDRFAPGVFDKSAMRRKFSLPGHGFVILMIARAVPSKRHDLMFEAFSVIQTQFPHAHLALVAIACEPGQARGLQASIARMPDPGAVTLIPFVRDTREIECAADVVVLPSDEEPLGTCILEAMSLAIPVVVSNNGGTHELIELGVSGLVMSAGDASSLTVKLRELIENAELAQQLGLAARKRIEAKFTIHEHARRVRDVFYRTANLTCSDETSRGKA